MTGTLSVIAAPTPAASNTTAAPSPPLSSAVASPRSVLRGSTTCCAPSAVIAARRSGETSLTRIFVCPRALRANHRPMPIGPAPTIIARSPRPKGTRFTAACPTAIGSTSAPSSSDTESGSGWTMSTGSTVSSESPPPGPANPWKAITRQMLGMPRRHAAHVPQLYAGRAATFRPTRSASTPEPTSVTVPANS